jgi:putative membrane protein
MFHDGSYMVGMHVFWWLFWLLLIGVWFFSALGRPGRRGDRPRETAHRC